MQHKCRMTVIDKKLYPELQRQYCADPEERGVFLLQRGGRVCVRALRGARRLLAHGRRHACEGRSGAAGSEGTPHCSEAWDAVSRYIYTALQGGSIMQGWMNDERVMICCCSDGTRPVIFKLERLDYMAVYVSGGTSRVAVIAALSALEGVSDVVWRDEGLLRGLCRRQRNGRRNPLGRRGCWLSRRNA